MRTTLAFNELTTDFLNKSSENIRIIKYRENMMFMYVNSGQNKLNVNEKEKMTPIYISEKSPVSRQFSCTCNKNKTVFIKNGVRIEIDIVLTVIARKTFVFVSKFSKKRHILWYGYFLGRWEKLHCEKCIVLPE